MNPCCFKQCACATACNLEENIISVITPVNGVSYTGTININRPQFFKSLDCASEKFRSIVGDNVFDEIRNQVNKIYNSSTTATQEIALIVFGGLAIILFLLILTIFAGLYWRDKDYVIIVTFVISLLILIVGIIVIYFWSRSVFDSTSNAITLNFNNLNQILDNVQMGATAGLCCFGQLDCGTKGKRCSCEASIFSCATGCAVQFPCTSN